MITCFCYSKSVSTNIVRAYCVKLQLHEDHLFHSKARKKKNLCTIRSCITVNNRHKGILSMGKEKINQKFSINVQLQGVGDNEYKLLDTYTYLAKDNKRRRYTERPILTIEDTSIKGPSIVYIPELIKGISWESDYLSKEFANLPYTITKKIGEIFEDIKFGKLWNELKQEEIEIKD